MLHELLHDLRHGLRSMLKSPGFTLVALTTMALGIGANTAMFSIVNGVILKPLPYPEADRVVRLWESNLPRGWSTFSIAPLNFWDWQERNRSLELLGAYRTAAVVHTGGDQPESLRAYRVSEQYLAIVGAEPIRGRGITRQDLDPRGEAVVVVSHGFWLRALGGDTDVLGRTLVLDGVAHTVVGILPWDWRPPTGNSPDLVLPLKPELFWFTARGSHFLQALGRLKPGVTLEQAQTEFSAIAAALAAEYPESNTEWGATLSSLEEVVVGSVRDQLFILLASVGLILLIGCANLANMTLARTTVRSRELAIRTALGAGKGRVARQLLAESALLAAAGGALGVALAYGALHAFVTGWPTLLPRMQEIEINIPVLLFSLGLAGLSGILFGLIPALIVAPDLGDALKRGSRSIAGDRSRRRMRAGLVAGEVALAVVLLVGTGLLMRSFTALASEDPGFRTEDRLVFATPLASAKYTSADEIMAFGQAALGRIEALPGVETAALSSLVPIEGSDEIWGFWVHGRASTSPDGDGSALFYRVSPGYHETMGIPLLAGRGIRQEDGPEAPLVAVVSASIGEKHFPGEDLVGQRIRFDDSVVPEVEIVGVVGDVQHYRLGETSLPQIYVPFAQRPTRNAHFVVKASVPPLGLVDGVRTVVEGVDPDQPLEGIRTAEAMVSGSISTPRFRTLLMTAFGLLALLLAAVGLYGVMAYNVTQRTKEIGVRMALGATRGSIFGVVFREGAPLVGTGLLAGMAGALALSRILESLLFGVGARDLAVFTAVPLVLAGVACVALLLPARRATRVDPVRTLGEE